MYAGTWPGDTSEGLIRSCRHASRKDWCDVIFRANT